MSKIKHQIIHSDRTLWINDKDGHCIARFDKRAGIDIHNTFYDQEKTGIQCLFCVNKPLGGKCTIYDWFLFIEMVYHYFKIKIDETLLKFE